VEVLCYEFLGQLQELLSFLKDYKKGDTSFCLNHHCPWLPFDLKSPECDFEPLSCRWYLGTLELFGMSNIATFEEWELRGRPFLIPLVLYLDKTGTDMMCRYSLEPFIFSLLLFSRKKRNLARYWRHLGFIPDLEFLSRSENQQQTDGKGPQLFPRQGRNLRNYHRCLDPLLKVIKEIGQGLFTGDGFVLKTRALTLSPPLPQEPAFAKCVTPTL